MNPQHVFNRFLELSRTNQWPQLALHVEAGSPTLIYSLSARRDDERVRLLTTSGEAVVEQLDQMFGSTIAGRSEGPSKTPADCDCLCDDVCPDCSTPTVKIDKRYRKLRDCDCDDDDLCWTCKHPELIAKLEGVTLVIWDVDAPSGYKWISAEDKAAFAKKLAWVQASEAVEQLHVKYRRTKADGHQPVMDCQLIGSNVSWRSNLLHFINTQDYVPEPKFRAVIRVVYDYFCKD